MRKTVWITALLLVCLAVPVLANWSYYEIEDPMTDQKTEFWAVPSTCETGIFGVLRYSDGTMEVIYDWGRYLIGDRDNDVLIRYRVDGGTPSNRDYWRMSPGNNTRAVPLEASLDRRIIRLLPGAKELVLEVVDPADNDVQTHVFNVRGYNGPRWG